MFLYWICIECMSCELFWKKMHLYDSGHFLNLNFEMLLTILCINMTINWLDLIHQNNSKMIFVENSSEWYISLMQLMYWYTANDISCGVDVLMHTAIPSLIAALDTWLVIHVSVFNDPKNMTKLYKVYIYIYIYIWTFGSVIEQILAYHSETSYLNNAYFMKMSDYLEHLCCVISVQYRWVLSALYSHTRHNFKYRMHMLTWISHIKICAEYQGMTRQRLVSQVTNWLKPWEHILTLCTDPDLLYSIHFLIFKSSLDGVVSLHLRTVTVPFSIVRWQIPQHPLHELRWNLGSHVRSTFPNDSIIC